MLPTSPAARWYVCHGSTASTALNPTASGLSTPYGPRCRSPFFFDPVRVDCKGTTYEDVDYPKGSVTWVDGGLLSNFPVEVFDRSDGQPARWPTIGIKLGPG